MWFTCSVNGEQIQIPNNIFIATPSIIRSSEFPEGVILLSCESRIPRMLALRGWLCQSTSKAYKGWQLYLFWLSFSLLSFSVSEFWLHTFLLHVHHSEQWDYFYLVTIFTWSLSEYCKVEKLLPHLSSWWRLSMSVLLSVSSLLVSKWARMWDFWLEHELNVATSTSLTHCSSCM